MEVWNSMKTQTTTDRTARHHHSHFLSRRVFTNKRTREPSVVGWVSAEGMVLLSIKVLGSQRIPYYAKKTKLLYWPPSGDSVEGTCGGEFGYKAQLGRGVSPLCGMGMARQSVELKLNGLLNRKVEMDNVDVLD